MVMEEKIFTLCVFIISDENLSLFFAGTTSYHGKKKIRETNLMKLKN